MNTIEITNEEQILGLIEEFLMSQGYTFPCPIEDKLNLLSGLIHWKFDLLKIFQGELIENVLPPNKMFFSENQHILTTNHNGTTVSRNKRGAEEISYSLIQSLEQLIEKYEDEINLLLKNSTDKEENRSNETQSSKNTKKDIFNLIKILKEVTGSSVINITHLGGIWQLNIPDTSLKFSIENQNLDFIIKQARNKIINLAREKYNQHELKMNKLKKIIEEEI